MCRDTCFNTSRRAFQFNNVYAIISLKNVRCVFLKIKARLCYIWVTCAIRDLTCFFSFFFLLLLLLLLLKVYYRRT